LKDNLSIDYRGLTGRFIFVKREFKNLLIELTSEVLNINQSTTGFFIANYIGCRWSQLLNKYYIDYGYLLQNAKIQTLSINLKKHEIESFDFQSLVYVKQMGVYYLINKETK
jgi:hypothetical protein